MVSNKHSRWTVAGATFAVWALVAACTVYWGLRLTGQRASSSVAPPVTRVVAPADPVVVARLLGASPTAAVGAPIASLSSRFSLIGVVASRSHQGAALIAVDGRPAKPFRVGSAIDEGLMLQSVESRKAVIATSAGGPPVLTLELPAIRR